MPADASPLIPPPDPGLPVSSLVDRIRAGVIGDAVAMPGPFGDRRITYADYTASGRAVDFIEDTIRSKVLPAYANTHTESSGTGWQTTQLREDARAMIKEAVGADADCVLLFAGSGSTAAIDRLIAYVSGVCTLKPGDVIFTGTPPGVGAARKPPLYLRAGNRVEVEIERLGGLENPVVAE